MGAAAVAAAAAPGCGRDPWRPEAYRKPPRSRVAIVPAERYGRPLVEPLLEGLRAFDLDVRRKRVVLKPNFVEFDPDGVINTHPAVLAGAVEAFRRLGASEVVVAEGAGHRRDLEYLLSGTGIGSVLADLEVPFVDLNHDAVRRMRLPSRFTEFGHLYLPETVLGADLFVSMPKMKTHHWAGVTLSMKNLFGIVPGSIYGWPKNALHWAGIGNSILDINAAIERPRFNIVDGVTGMEGNGPIQGDAIHSGVLVLGADPVAVDATCARLMSIDPERVDYLREAAAFLGNLDDEAIDHAGESIDRYRKDYAVLETFRSIKATSRAASG